MKNKEQDQVGMRTVRVLPAIKKIFALSGTFQRLYFMAFTLDIILALTLLASNHALRLMFDSISNKDPHNFWFFLWLAVGIGIFELPLIYLRTHYIGSFSERTLTGIRKKVARQATALPVQYLENHHTGDMLSIINADLAKVRRMTRNDLNEIQRISWRPFRHPPQPIIFLTRF